MEVENKVAKVDGHELLEKVIDSLYEDEKVASVDKSLDYDSLGKDVELFLIRVPKKFNVKKLKDKSIDIEDSLVGTLNVDKEWQLTESNDDTGNSQPIMPVQHMDGITAPAPLKINHHLKITRKVDVSQDIEAVKRMRDEPFETPKQKLGLKMHFHPVGFFTGEKEELVKQEMKDKKTKKHKKGKEEKIKEKEHDSFNVTKDSEVKVENQSTLDTPKKNKKKKKKDKKE